MPDSARKILIAEDNPGLARVLSFKFKACGFTPITCADGQLAWEMFQNEDVSAVVSDQEMPRMTGVELCANIREVNANIPLFLVCLLYTSPSPRDQRGSRMPSSA